MNKIFRANRTRAKIHGTEERPRLTVHISNLNVTAHHSCLRNNCW